MKHFPWCVAKPTQIWAKSKIERDLNLIIGKYYWYFRKRISPNINKKGFYSCHSDSWKTKTMENEEIGFLIFIVISANNLCRWLLIINLLPSRPARNLIARFCIPLLNWFCPRNFFLYAGTTGLVYVCIMPIAISFFNFVNFWL